MANCSSALDTYYREVKSTHDPDPSLLCFPNPTPDPSESSTAAPSPLPELEYEGFLTRNYSVVRMFDDPGPSELRSPLVAKMAKNDKDVVLVKFATTYCAEAHRILADKGLAPQLYHCRRVLGGMYMVVMEHLFNYKRLEDSEKGGGLPDSVISEMKCALSELHSKGFVHGDFRAVNIMISPENDHAKVIDFDWAAKEDEGRYTESINTKQVHAEWHEGVNAGKPMKKEHDIEALEIMVKKYSVVSK